MVACIAIIFRKIPIIKTLRANIFAKQAMNITGL